MQGDRIIIPVHIPGTLAANISVLFQAVKAMTLVAVQSVQTVADTDATFTLGTSASAAAYLTAKDVGDNSVPTVLDDRTDFVGEQFPHIAAGTVIALAVDFDGAGGTAAANLTILMEFEEG